MDYWIRSSEWFQPIFETKDTSTKWNIKTLSSNRLCVSVRWCVAHGSVLIVSFRPKNVLLKATLRHKHEHESSLYFVHKPTNKMWKISFDASCSDFYVFFLHLMPETGQPKPWKLEKYSHHAHAFANTHTRATRATHRAHLSATRHAHSVGKSFYYHIAIKKCTQNSFCLSANKIQSLF